MTVWVVYSWDIDPIVWGIYADELEARRAADSWQHVVEVKLPCESFDSLVRRK